ncbi:hypothetical protein [uncultured Tateyamaria sp.]|uniref:hypothetical protein n=1 Tax=uncultured Tateyamaria sp. TaxID=455651 RepID=UPI00263829A1|nr:hypothetical protein [uncultured Tateyamaria sp.]
MRIKHRHRIAAKATEPDGFVHPMARHVAMYFPRSTKRLVVSFDNVMSRAAPRPHFPWGANFVDRMGASHLGLMMASPDDWFRHADVWAFFDGLRDDGFFESFDEVIFYGSSMGGYGALTFAKAAPGARVVAMVPQTHLDPSVVPFETRYDAGFARGKWFGPYLDAVDGARAASVVYVLYDPHFGPDAAHVARLDPANLVELRLPWSLHHSGPILSKTGRMNDVLEAAFDGTLTATSFRAMVRAGERCEMGARQSLRAGLSKGHPKLVMRALSGLAQSHPEWEFPKIKERAHRLVQQAARTHEAS